VLGELRAVRDAGKAELAGTIALCPPSALQDRWTRRFPDPVSAFASGWMRVRARARQRGVELPLVISDHADWEGLTATVAATGASQIWVTHGAEEALVHWCTMRGLEARPLGLVGYGDEDEETPVVIPGEAKARDPGPITTERSNAQGVGVMDPGAPPDGVGRDDSAP
jgi:putative mRNA 3-end processing factor